MVKVNKEMKKIDMICPRTHTHVGRVYGTHSLL